MIAVVKPEKKCLIGDSNMIRKMRDYSVDYQQILDELTSMGYDELVEQIIERLDENEEKKAGAGKRKLLQKKIIAAAKALNAAKDLTDEAGYETEGIKEKINEINESISKIEDYIEH